MTSGLLLSPGSFPTSVGLRRKPHFASPDERGDFHPEFDDWDQLGPVRVMEGACIEPFPPGLSSAILTPPPLARPHVAGHAHGDEVVMTSIEHSCRYATAPGPHTTTARRLAAQTAARGASLPKSSQIPHVATRRGPGAARPRSPIQPLRVAPLLPGACGPGAPAEVASGWHPLRPHSVSQHSPHSPRIGNPRVGGAP